MRQKSQKAKKQKCSVASVQAGVVFSNWTVLGENPHKRHGKVLCKCSCGTEREVLVSNLVAGRSLSCGCSFRYNATFIESGSIFGKWTVLGQNPHTRHGLVLCRCICGVEKMVFVNNLLTGLSKSCGCTRRFRKDCIPLSQGSCPVLSVSNWEG